MMNFDKLRSKIRIVKEIGLASGRGYYWLLLDYLSLAGAPNYLGLSEYFDYKLFSPVHSKLSKRTFLGYRAERIYSLLNHHSWHATANDKVLYEQIMKAGGMQAPTTLAIYHPWRIVGATCPQLRNQSELSGFFAECRGFPLIAKPIHGLFGRGIMAIDSYDDKHKILSVRGQGVVTIDWFAHWLSENSRAGMLFQSLLQPSLVVREVCGERLSTIRMIVLCDGDAPRLFRANWKLCTGDNLVDNTDGWRNGNLVAAVDHETGTIESVWRGVEGRQISVSAHPDTNVNLIGRQVPDWHEAKKFVERAACLFPGVRFQAWDIASTDKGIMGLELNLATLHTVRATQLVSGRGFLDDRLKAALYDISKL